MDYKTRNKHRYLILTGLHDRAGRDREAACAPAAIGAAVALTPSESEMAADELEEEGLVERTGELEIRLTGEGIRTAERVLRRELRATDAYPDVTDYVDSERGTHSTSDIAAFLTSLEQVLPALKLDADGRRDLRAGIERVAAQLRLPIPSRTLALEGLVYIRSVLERAAEGAGVPILARVTRLIDEPARPGVPTLGQADAGADNPEGTAASS